MADNTPPTTLDVHIDFTLDFFPDASMEAPALSAIEMVKKLETDLYTLWDFYHQHGETQNLLMTLSIDGFDAGVSRTYSLSAIGDTIPD